MKTLSFSIENLCVPCGCVCRHCLLSAGGKGSGVTYERGEAFAEKFHAWAAKCRPELGVSFYVGYCNDFPQLPQYIRALHKFSPQLRLLQFNGLAIRSEAETESLLETVKDGGMAGFDLTFYGVGAYHDRFAGRKGDYAFLQLLLKKANEIGLDAAVSIAVTQENLNQLPQLLEMLSHYKIARIFAYLPHAKGRGERLSQLRLTAADFDGLAPDVQALFGSVPKRTEAEWIRRGIYPDAQGRHLTLALTGENIDRLESMDPAAVISELEAMDDAYYAAIPTPAELAKQYGNADNQQIFRYRDLMLQWQKRFLKEHPIDIPDMNDERHSFSVRLYDEFA